MQDNNFNSSKNENKKIHRKTMAFFIFLFVICTILIYTNISNKMDVESLTMERVIAEKSTKANEVLSRLLYKTQILAAFVMNNEGKLNDFDQVASSIIDDPAILNVLIAPDGIVTDVYPHEGNEAVIGLNYFGEGEGNKEAIAAKETGKLVFGGPFNAVQGGQILVGRLPVYLKKVDGKKKFWGLVSVTLKYPQVLDGMGLSDLQFRGYDYEIWRINPDDGMKQIITKENGKYSNNSRYLERHMKIQNADWYLRIFPIKEWYQYPDTWILGFLSLCISTLVAYVMQSNSKLKILKASFETLSHTDSLTGISNRRHFMDMAMSQIEWAKREGVNAYIIIFDIDYFKKINDLYGHSIGDDVLKGIVYRVKRILRSYDLFSRYGGEEFIIFVSEIDKKNVQEFAERIRLKISSKPFVCEGKSINVTASFGVSDVMLNNKVDDSINNADKALYIAKNGGRNRVEFYECNDSNGSRE